MTAHIRDARVGAAAHALLRVLAVGSSYFAAAILGRQLSTSGSSFVDFWPPSGLYLGLLLLSGRRARLEVMLGAALGNIGFDLFNGTAFITSIGFYTANTAHAALGALGVRSVVRRRPTLDSVSELVLILVVGGVAGAALGALIGAFALVQGGLRDDFFASWAQWTSGAAAATLLITPLVLSWSGFLRDVRVFFRPARWWLELTALLTMLLVATALGGNARELLLVPLLLWSGLRFGTRGSTAACLIVALLLALTEARPVASWLPLGALVEHAPLTDHLFLGVSTSVGLVPAIVLGQQTRTTRALQESEARLQEANQRKSEFLSLLSHELRTPLASIRSSLCILDRAPAVGDASTRAKAILTRQVEQLTRLVDDLLDMTRVTHGKIALRLQPLALDELVLASVEEYRAVLSAAGVELKVVPPPQKLYVNGDPTRLAQVIGNLLHNAAKFTPAGGKVTVSLEADMARHQAVVHVRDTGRGFTAAFSPHLFEPFAQASHSMERSEGGLGLGLALVKRLVELQGGSVGAASNGLGTGATFTVALFLEDVGPAEPSLPEAVIAPARRVLIIEDNVDAADTLQAVLELAGHTVAVAYRGPEGLEKAHSFRPDVVLCDIGLPEMDGYEVARALHSDARHRRARLIALSGYAQPEDVDAARAAGFDAHLAKPADMDLLERELASAVPADC